MPSLSDDAGLCERRDEMQAPAGKTRPERAAAGGGRGAGLALA